MLFFENHKNEQILAIGHSCAIFVVFKIISEFSVVKFQNSETLIMRYYGKPLKNCEIIPIAHD
jgi:hypothetical protein